MSIQPPTKTNLPKIELNNRVRQWIEEYIKVLHQDIASAPDQKNNLQSEVANLDGAAEQLAREIVLLKPEAINSDDAAGKLHAKETRLREVQNALAGAGKRLSELKTPNFHGAAEILRAMLAAYHQQLPALIGRTVMYICPDESSTRVVIQTCGATKALKYWRDRTYMIDTEPATPDAIYNLIAVLERGLRGQPFLGADQPEYFESESRLPATAEDLPPVAEIAEQPQGADAKDVAEVAQSAMAVVPATESTADTISRAIDAVVD